MEKQGTSNKKAVRKTEKTVIKPSIEEIDAELFRIKKRQTYRKALKGTVYSLVVIAAIAFILASAVFPVLRVYGTSMEPDLTKQDILIGMKNVSYQQGDIIAFYYNNKVLLKRVIATAGDTVFISENGDVYVNDVLLDEPYIKEKAFGICDIEFPITIPDSQVFVLGDNRATALDSRTSTIGNVKTEDIICKVVLRIWPLNRWCVLQ